MTAERAARALALRTADDSPHVHHALAEAVGEHEVLSGFCRTPTYILEGIVTSALASRPAPRGLEQTFSLDNLTQEDRAALTAYVRATHPLIVVSGDAPTLESTMELCDVTAEQLWHSLSCVSDARLAIAAFALRGVTRCPDDPQLDPRPHDRAPVRSPRSPEEAARRPRASAGSRGSAGEYLASVAPNPKRRGSAAAERYALYSVGLTRTQLTERGLRADDFKNDTEKGYISWADAPPADEALLAEECGCGCENGAEEHEDARTVI